MSADDVDRAIDPSAPPCPEPAERVGAGRYEAAVQRHLIDMAGKAAGLRELLDTALGMLATIARHEGGSAQDAIMAEVDVLRSAANAIQSRKDI